MAKQQKRRAVSARAKQSATVSVGELSYYRSPTDVTAVQTSWEKSGSLAFASYRSSKQKKVVAHRLDLLVS